MPLVWCSARRWAALVACLGLGLLAHAAPPPPPAPASCGAEGQLCCGSGSGLTCKGDLFCDAPKCKVEASKCWRLPKYPDECGVAGKPCCPLFKCTDASRWPKDYPQGRSVYDGFACKEGVDCDYGTDSSKAGR
ncbi:hypothetical protein ABPG75_013474 [Micractinium tetrahymenae]